MLRLPGGNLLDGFRCDVAGRLHELRRRLLPAVDRSDGVHGVRLGHVRQCDWVDQLRILRGGLVLGRGGVSFVRGVYRRLVLGAGGLVVLPKLLGRNVLELLSIGRVHELCAG